MTHMWFINRDFSKMRHDSLVTTTCGFREVEKPTWVNFWRGLWWNAKNFAIVRFCIRQRKMAFETPFVPRRLHFKFGPSGVKYIHDSMAPVRIPMVYMTYGIIEHFRDFFEFSCQKFNIIKSFVCRREWSNQILVLIKWKFGSIEVGAWSFRTIQ